MWLLVAVCMLLVSWDALGSIGAKSYSKLFSFNGTLNRKMAHYPDVKVAWLKAYMNLFLPFLVYGSVTAAYAVYQSEDLFSIGFIYSALYGLIMVFNCIFFRFIDSFAFYFNIFTNIVWAVNSIIQVFAYPDNADLYIFPAIITVLFVACNLYYFYKKRELFFCTEKQIYEKYALV